jgi:cytochrome c oxidase subunit 6a
VRHRYGDTNSGKIVEGIHRIDTHTHKHTYTTMFRTVAKNQAKVIGRRFQSNLDKAAYTPNLAKGAEFAKHIEAVEHHAQGSSGTWKKVSFFLAAPIIALTAVNTWIVEKEHAEHREHNKHLSDEEWPVPSYPYLNMRRVDFFWGDGDKTLFWNSDCNRHIK